MTLLDEIREQPGVLAGLIETQMAAVAEAAAVIKARSVNQIYLAARGTSEHAGIYGQYALGALARLPLALAAPSLFTVYGRPPRLAGALVVGVSQSGQSPDIVAVLEEGRRQGALTMAITNDVNSPLAEVAELALPISAGPEQAVAATKTYTGELMLFAMLAAALAGDDERRAELSLVPRAVEAALALEEAVIAAAERFKAMSSCVILGRGYHFATAMEWSLKLKELTYVVADRYSTAEFQHGPVAMVEPGFPVLAVAPSDPGQGPVRELLRSLAVERGAQLLALSDDDDTLAAAGAGLKLPGGVPPWLMPIVSIVPAQLFCLHLALAKGLDPTAPRGLSKVTLTR